MSSVYDFMSNISLYHQICILLYLIATQLYMHVCKYMQRTQCISSDLITARLAVPIICIRILSRRPGGPIQVFAVSLT